MHFEREVLYSCDITVTNQSSALHSDHIEYL